MSQNVPKDDRKCTLSLHVHVEGPTPSLPRGSSSRPMVARLVRYGPVRQRKLFYGGFGRVELDIRARHGAKFKVDLEKS